MLLMPMVIKVHLPLPKFKPKDSWMTNTNKVQVGNQVTRLVTSLLPH